jgi:hypothetical protein
MRISPPKNDDTAITTYVDTLEAIKDLETLLFSGNGSNCSRLEELSMHAMSMALFSAYTNASFGISKPNDGGTATKTAVDECCTLVSKVAVDLELCKNNRLWNIFVVAKTVAIVGIFSTKQARAPSPPTSPQDNLWEDDIRQITSFLDYIVSIAVSGLREDGK